MKGRNITLEMLQEEFFLCGVIPELAQNISKLVKNETHVSHWRNIFLRYDIERGLADELVACRKLLQIETYQSLFPKYVRGDFNQKYSPILAALMEVPDFVFTEKQAKVNAKVIADYINRQGFDISMEKFESFVEISKYINWSKLIKENKKRSTFGNPHCMKILEDSFENIFLAKRTRNPYYPAGILDFILLTSYGVYGAEEFYYRILENDPELTISDTGARTLLKDFVSVDISSIDLSNVINTYYNDNLPLISTYALYFFKRKLDNFSDDFKLLARLS